MQNLEQPYDQWSVAQAPAETRTEFIHKTYQHLALAIAAFVGVEALFLNTPAIVSLGHAMSGGMMWLVVLAAFMGVSTIASRWAMQTTSSTKAYMGLGLYVVAEALIFVPLMSAVVRFGGGSDAILKAGWMTAIVFFGLTAAVMFSKKDFSFLRGILTIAGFASLGLIVTSILLGFSLGTLYAAGMVVFAAGAILYETSNIMNHYRPGQHVAASLALFSSVALLFFYVLRIVGFSRD